MTLGLQESRHRRRRRARWAVARWLLTVVVLVGLGVFAYETGTTLAEREVEALSGELTELGGRLEELQRRNGELQATVVLAEQRLTEVERRYQAEVPQGPLAGLLAGIRDKLEAGVDPARLAFVIESAGSARRCENAPTTKRFIVQTPFTRGANDAVSFAENAITVTAQGEPASDAQGKPEARFDPAKPVTVRFARLGGKATEVAGTLPLHASVVLGDSEHRFTLIAGPQRGFVQVTADRCAFP